MKRQMKRRVTRRAAQKRISKILSLVLVLAVIVGLCTMLAPSQNVYASEDKTANMEGFSATLIADPDTSQDATIFNGSSAEDGKIWTDKSVTTGTIYGATAGEENFNVALSAMAQTYSTVEAGMSAEEQKVAYDVVFVLDFSGSMDESVSGSNTSKAEALVNAINPAIATLMENENSRIAIVGYSSERGTTTAVNSTTTELFPLDHYTTTADDGSYLEYYSGNRNNAIRSARDGQTYYVKNSSGTNMTATKNVDGGTPTQSGIYKGMSVLQNADKSGDVTRIPILVLLTDGKAGVAKSGYTDLSGDTYTGSAHSGSNDSRVGTYTMLTANYAKDTLDRAYKTVYDYNGIIKDYNENTEVAKFYTIGLGITNNSWTHFMLDPGTADANSDSTVRSIKNLITQDNTYGSDYNYADAYFGGSMTEDDLKKAFQDILSNMSVEPEFSISVNSPVSSELGGGAAGSYVTFTDYLGYKMELKGTRQFLRYNSVNYEFLKQADGTYKFSGKTQDGEETVGPQIVQDGVTYTLNDVIFKAEKDETLTVNGQTGYYKVTWSFPSAFLPTYSRTNDYATTNLRPIRMLYEVGLEDSTDLRTDGLKIDEEGKLLPANAAKFHDYAFYTNLYNFEAGQAMTTVDFTPAKDNPYYFKTGYTTDKDTAGTTTEYLKIDMVSYKKQNETLEGTANVELTNIRFDGTSRMYFTYGGQVYSIALSGDWNSYSGSTNVTVQGTTDDGETISADVVINVRATRSLDWGGWSELSASSITVNGESATLSDNKTTASASVTISEIRTPDPDAPDNQEVVSVYLELKQDAEGFYVEDLNGKRLDVTPNADGTYTLQLGNETHTSNVHYKYEDYTSAYTDKNIDKGNIIKSFVGQLEVKQPAEGETLTEANYRDYFQYHSADGETVTKVTGILFPDGTSWGTVTQTGEANRPPKGTFKVCIDGIKNLDNPGVEINFDFIVEAQNVDGGIKYAVLDAAYFEGTTSGQQQYSLEINLSNTPGIDLNTGNYLYDVSYTITTQNADDVKSEGNKTHTDNGFFESKLGEGNGDLDVWLGNNGRVAVAIADNTYEKNVTVVKTWRDRLGNPILTTDAALADVSVEAGLYQSYTYTDESGNVISTEDSPVIFKNVILNQENGFTYMWSAEELPKYLVDFGGNFVLDKDGNQVPVSYVVGEVSGADGWHLDSTQVTLGENTNIYTLVNVPSAGFDPSVEKVWTRDGETMETAPDGYQVRFELLANGEPVVTRSVEDTSNQIFATLIQADSDSDAILEVSFGTSRDTAKTIGTETVKISDFENTPTKEYVFNYDQSTGTPGAGDYSTRADISVMISDTFGGKLGISDARTKYYYNDANGTEQSVTLSPRNVVRGETDTEKTADFTMNYVAEHTAVVTLDGKVDADEKESWKYTWENWDLPLLQRDETTGEYKAVVYSVRETLLVPNSTGGFDEYSADANGLIKVSQTDGNNQVTTRVFKMTSANTTDYQFTVTNDEGLTNVAAQKVWVDNNNAYSTRPDSITFTLYADGAEVADSAKTFTSADTEIWNGTKSVEWTNVPLYNETTGAEIVYTVQETMVTSPDSDKYETTVTRDAADANSFTVTNSLSADPEINTTSMEVEKVWIDDNDAAGVRPDYIQMVLWRQTEGGTASVVPGAGSVITLAKDPNTGEWQTRGTWNDLPKYNEQGQKYIYSVREYNNYADGATDGVAGYTDVSTSDDKTETKYTFRNQLNNGSVEKTVTKVWNDAALADARPENVTVVLGAVTTDGAAVDLSGYNPTQVLSADGAWSYTWSNLPEYFNGMKVDYTITETKVGDTDVANGKAGKYATSVTDDGAGNTFTVTNTLAENTTVKVSKTWENLPDGFAIPEVVFDVLDGNGNTVATLTVNAENPTAETTLPKYTAGGERITYTVREQEIAIADGADYTIDSTIGGNTAQDGSFEYAAVNTYRLLNEDIVGTKTWSGIGTENLPDSITVALYRQVGDGDRELVKDAGTGEALQPTWVKNGQVWTYTYTDMPLYQDEADADTKYEYTIEETKVGTTEVVGNKAGDYTVTVSGMNITNTLGGTVDGGSLAGIKRWVNVEEEQTPDSIMVRLLRSKDDVNFEPAKDMDGNDVADIIVTKAGQDDVQEWSYDFGGNTLPKYDENGNEYIYAVQEVSITAGTITEEVVTKDEERTAGDYIVTTDGLNITNTLKPDNEKDQTTAYQVIKRWLDKNGAPLNVNLPESITVQLYQDGEPYETYTFTAEDKTSDSEWSHTFTGLRKYQDDGITPYTYTVDEVSVNDRKDGELVSIAVENNKAGAYTVSVAGNVITNQSSDDVAVTETSVTIQKIWEGVTGENIPAVTVQLVQDGVPMDDRIVELTADKATVEGNTWSYVFENLPVYNANGVLKHEYTVKEISVKVNGSDVAVANGKAGDYEVTESGLTITNKLTGTVDISGQKVWKDAAQAQNRPESVSVKLVRSIDGENFVDAVDADGNPIQTTVGAPADDSTAAVWSFAFENVAKYDADGNEYIYEVREIGENGETVVYDGKTYHVGYSKDAVSGDFVITNTLTGTTGPIEVTKVWVDDDNSQSARPESVSMYLERSVNGDTERVAELTLTKEDAKIPGTGASLDDSNEWNDSFGDQPKYDENGAEYLYEVKEEEIENYVLEEITGDAENGFTVTNKYSPGNKTVTIQKTWKDNGDAEAKRPESITLKLLQNGEVYAEKEVTAEDGWKASFVVPVADGSVYEYTADEADVVVADESGDVYVKSADGLNVTNTLAGTEHVQGTKSWKDISEEYRPESVTVELWRQLPTEETPSPVKDASGETMAVVTNAEQGWAYDFGKLDKYDENGAKYTYLVKETYVGKTPLEETDYVYETDGYDLENKIKDETKTQITVSGKKTWVDNNDQYQMRPGSITVNLLCDDVKIDSAVVTAAEDGTWSYAFEGLPKYDMTNGKLLTYNVEEEDVDNYVAAVDGYNLTNTLDESKIPTEPEEPVEPEEPEDPQTPEEPETPKPDNNGGTSIKTGDETAVALIAAVMAAAFMAIVGMSMLILRKKRR